MSWEIVVGIETHAQLRTQSKIFSGAATAFGIGPLREVAGRLHTEGLGGIAVASAACTGGAWRSATIVAPAGAMRSRVIFSVFSTTLGASPGSSVETTPIFLIL